MIVQSSSPGHPHFIIAQVDHARMSGEVAQAFGNAQFARPEPNALLTYIVAHHDEGWAEVDRAQICDPRTRLPYHLTQTPLTDLVTTGPRSPDFNEQHHAYCGLLSSMHTYGLYHGRYGLSDKIFIDNVPAEHQATVAQMLSGELERQARLKATLAADPASAAWVADPLLFTNYKLLQFFDTLALYFHMTHAAARAEAKFLHVPLSPSADTTLTIRPVNDDTYALTPWPFNIERLTVSVPGRYLAPLPDGADAQAALHAAPSASQTYTLVAEGKI
jgi:hypothetical protein